jgi:ubiquinone/menaquinone biosynthesis C-methylase UbiE
MADWESIFKKSGKVFFEPQEDMGNVVSLMKEERVKKVLDLGCGSGRHTVMLAKEGFEVYATDISREALRLTKKWLEESKLSATIKIASCYDRFPFENNFFDAIISTQVIHHNYHDKVKFCISEIERVLKPKGILFVSVPASKYKRGATKFKMPQLHTYISLDGEEKGIPHFIYTKTLLKSDFSHFTILDIHKDKGNHYCLLGKLKKI